MRASSFYVMLRVGGKIYVAAKPGTHNKHSPYISVFVSFGTSDVWFGVRGYQKRDTRYHR